VLKWIQPRESAVEFDPGGEDKSQFIIDDFLLKNCSYVSSDGLYGRSDVDYNLKLRLHNLAQTAKKFISNGQRLAFNSTVRSDSQ